MTQSKALLWAVIFAAALGPAPWSLAEMVPPGTDMALGDPHAKVTVTEYASMSCPHCAEFNNLTFPRLKAEYVDTGKIRYVFREYPLDQPAVYGAILARCAGQERFFPFVDALFKQQSTWVLSPDPIPRLIQIGQLGGLSSEEFQACLADRGLLNGILETRLNAERTYNVQSTPTFVIGNAVVEGALPYEQFKKVLDAAVAGQPIPGARGASSPSSKPSSSNVNLYVALGAAALLIAAAAAFFLRRPKPTS